MPAWVTRLLKLLPLVLALSACTQKNEPPTQILHVGSQRGGTKAMMIASGVLKGAPYKIEWSEFAAAQPLLEAIGAGAVDVGLAGDAPFMFAYQSGSPIKAVAAQLMTDRPTDSLAIMVPRGSSIRSLADLKGRNVATTRGSVGHYLVIRALSQAQLPRDWVKLVFLAPGDARAAFSTGAVDSWAIWTPYVKAAIDDGARVIVDGHNLVRGYGFDVANEKSIAAKRAILADFLNREARALAWAKQNPDAYAEVLARETRLPAALARDLAVKAARLMVPITDEVIAYQQDVIDDFRRAGAGVGTRPLTQAFDRNLASPAEQ
jgi:sulfonate transport system substrate-binding protein